MDDYFRQWKSAEKLNEVIATPVCNYVLILTETRSFDVIEDLKFALHITKKPSFWFVEKFRAHGVRVEYATIFCKKDIEQFGPIAQATSQGIFREYLRSTYRSPVVLVCQKRYAKQFLPFESIHPETFVRKLLGRRD